MKLVVISHTEHYINSDGKVAGWGPTVREIDAIADLFDEVVHIACLFEDKPVPDSATVYANDNVRFLGIEPFGGRGFKNKFSIITSASKNLKLIRDELSNADMFHFRAPTSVGLYIIPYLSLSGKKGWFKYAGNWAAQQAPLSYRIQRWMLSNQPKKVTINGYWIKQPEKCITFENPCLYEDDRVIGNKLLQSKHYKPPFTLCFAGRLDKQKGIYQILEAIKGHPDRSLFSSLEIVGDGPENEMLKLQAKNIDVKVNFHSALGRADLFEVYKRAHFLLLPSESEGFPKVIAEAANFGCIPIVSDVSSIGQYVNSSNGFLWGTATQTFADFFKSIDFSDGAAISSKAAHAHQMSALFTYSHYIARLKNEIIDG